jgi:flavin reductase (DIM6/NTAB) family NADH-FMN oxidoreductase RutF
MREIPVTEVANIVTEKMANGGVFLNVSDGERKNVMTIGWGGVNTFFGAPCFLAPVRLSRYSYDIILKNGTFTVSVPLHDMRRELAFAGSKSGRDVDKFSGHGMTAAPAQAVDVPIIKECELQIECTPLGRVEMNAGLLTPEVRGRCYADGDTHVFFLGKIVRCYYAD